MPTYSDWITVGQTSQSLSAAAVAHLIEQARSGSAEATGELLENCRAYLLLVANCGLNAELRPKQAASDLVQETFFQANRDIAQFRGRSERELLAWLRKILVNQLALAHRKYQAAEKRDIARELPLRRDGSASNGGVLVACPRDSPSGQAVRAEELQRVELAIAQLPPRYAEVIQLRSGDLLSFNEIGARLEITADAARKLWVRAMERLQRELGTIQ